MLLSLTDDIYIRKNNNKEISNEKVFSRYILSLARLI
jgi:hypothetical protein